MWECNLSINALNDLAGSKMLKILKHLNIFIIYLRNKSIVITWNKHSRTHLISTEHNIDFFFMKSNAICSLVKFAFQDRKIISARISKDYIRNIYKFSQNHKKHLRSN